MIERLTMHLSVVDVPAQQSAGSTQYLFNRAPLRHNVMTRLPLGSIAPAGWIRRQLELMASGMVGQMPHISEFLTDENGWLGGEKEGWEEQAYWFRGFYDLAYILQDEALQQTAMRWIEAILGSMQDDGYFGPPKLKDRVGDNGQVLTDFWPHMVMIDALIHHQEATGDARIVPFLSRFFAYCAALPEAQFIPVFDHAAFGDWKPDVQEIRACDMLPHIYWLYNRTGEARLLDVAIRFYRHQRPPNSEYLDSHIVNFTQRFAYPAFFATQTNEPWLLDQAEYWYRQHLASWGQQPRGIFGADEHIRPGFVDPRQGFETCGFGEFAKSFYYLAGLTGQACYADRVEDLLFNHFPAAAMPDFRGVHYLTASNLPQLDGNGKHAYANDYRQLSYSATFYRCCVHNVAMTWPWYTEHLWMAAADGGLVALMYGASTVTAQVAAGRQVQIMQETDYPFRGAVTMRLALASPTAFPLYLRVPAWCEGFAVQINGETLDVAAGPQQFLRIEREWRDGDTVEVTMPMALSVARWPRTGAATVNRGPLSYSLKIGETWRDCGSWEWIEGNMRWDAPDGWPNLEVLPTTPWNYGLCLPEDASSFEVIEHGLTDLQPWMPEHAPIEIRATGKRIPEWTLEPVSGTIQELQESPIRVDGPEEPITLIPLGCARLRISCFPVVADVPHARTWVPATALAVKVAEEVKGMDM